jgi:hypothetical protein
MRRILHPVAGKVQTGVEYKWWAKGKKYRVRIHDPDPSVLPTPPNPRPNARAGWVARIMRVKEYMDPEGNLHPQRNVKPSSPAFDELIANETHIPILRPLNFP